MAGSSSSSSRSCSTTALVLLQILVVMLALWALIMAVAGVQGDAGSDYLAEKEKQVQQIVAQVELNDIQTCELVATCSAAANCSRRGCSTVRSDNFQCVDVPNNKYCTEASGGSNCTQLRAEYSISHVSLPPGTSLANVPAEMGNSICSQRLLDSTFQSISVPNNYTVVYYGAVDGTIRSFPGRVENSSECLSFDPRIRPWYTAAISVTKVLVVLIDNGLSMQIPLPDSFGFPSSITYLGAAKNITQSLLQTISPQDHVNIIQFNSVGAVPLSNTSVEGNGTELNALVVALDNIQGASEAGNSNLTAAIESALSNFIGISDALKVIIIFTDGEFALNSTVTLPETQLAPSVKVFIYKLPPPNDGDIFLSNNSLLSSLCGIGGTFEVIEQDITNPLYAVRSYFSYLASAQMASHQVQGKPLWTSPYQNRDVVCGYITTVTYPDVYIDELGNIAQLVRDALENQTNQGNIQPAIVTLNNLNCSLANASYPIAADERCGSSIAPTNGGICNQIDSIDTFESIVCSCSTCSDRDSGEQIHIGEIIGGAITGAIALVVVVLMLIFKCSCQKFGDWVIALCNYNPEPQDLSEPPIIHNFVDTPHDMQLDPVNN
ncbi:hypothetical protein BDL97_05G012500 [Sphagnum fallax]|nr:hypothetical protein BDL97_05G012500 [Sphagnum fallax]